MKKILYLFTSLAIAFGATLQAQDEAKKKKGPVSLSDRIMKRYDAVGLTDDQMAQIKELGTAAEAKLAAAKEKAALSDEQKQAQREAMEAAKTAGKSGKELRAAASAATTLTEEQQAAKQEMKTINAEFGKSVAALLTEEQKTKAKEARAAKAKPKPTS
ncbi:MAG: hypothetical protein AAGH89_06400 [Verrucomicrobiota bacterium]